MVGKAFDFNDCILEVVDVLYVDSAYNVDTH